VSGSGFFVLIARFEAINSKIFKCPDPDSFVHIVRLEAINSKIFKCPDQDSFVHIVRLEAIIPDYSSVRIRIILLLASNKFQNI
jgi:hypothetical protein